MNRAAALVVPLVRPAELRQAKYYMAVLDEQQARVDDKIAGYYVGLEQCPDSGDTRGLQRLHQRLTEQRREQFEVDRIRRALQCRFFPTRAALAKPSRCFDIEITRHGSWWMVQIPDIDGLTKTRRRDDAEMTAREHIAVTIDAPIAEVAVRVVNAP